MKRAKPRTKTTRDRDNAGILFRHIDERGAFVPSARRAVPSLHSVRIAAFSDIGEQDPAAITEWFGALREPVDFALYAGDGISRFRPSNGPNYFEQIAARTRFGLGVVIGNDEPETVRSLVSGTRVYELSERAAILGKYVFLGLDGAPARRGLRNPYERAGDDRISCGSSLLLQRYMSAQYGNSPWPAEIPREAVFVLCSHAPPWGMLDRTNRGLHLGWHFLAHVMMSPPRDTERRADRWPDYIICGHVHRRGGQVDGDNGVVVINVASNERATDPVRVALLTIEDRARRYYLPNGATAWLEPECDWRSVRPTIPPWLASGMPVHAWEVDNHTEIPGIQQPRAAVLRAAGFLGVAELARATVDQLRPLARQLHMGESELRTLPARARALVERRPIRLGKFERPTDPCIYVDIETDLGQSWIWLIGCLDSATGKLRQFVAVSPSDERRMLREFREFARERAAASWVAFSNCDLEQRLVGARLAHHGLAALSAPIKDIYAAIQSAMAFPKSGRGLKGAAASLGYRFKHSDLDGFSAGLSAPTAKTTRIPRELLEYNEDDLRSLAFLVEEVARLCQLVVGGPVARMTRA